MKLELIETNTAKNGAVYKVMTIDGKKYNFFGDTEGIHPGAEVLCEFETKGQFTNLKSIEKCETSKPGAVTASVQESRHDIVISRTEKPHSYEFGVASARHKIYYNVVSELVAQIEELKKAGLFIELA